jgi:hypothetical protein
MGLFDAPTGFMRSPRSTLPPPGGSSGCRQTVLSVQLNAYRIADSQPLLYLPSTNGAPATMHSLR